MHGVGGIELRTENRWRAAIFSECLLDYGGNKHPSSRYRYRPF
jgi:hypothetical protein